MLLQSVAIDPERGVLRDFLKKKRKRRLRQNTGRNHPLPEKVSAVRAKILIPILGLDSSQPWIRKRAWKGAGSEAAVLRKYCF